MKINRAVASLHLAEIKDAIQKATEAAQLTGTFEVDLSVYGIDLEDDYKRPEWIATWTKRKLSCHPALNIQSALNNSISVKYHAVARQRRYENKNAALAKLAIEAGLATRRRRNS